MPKTPLHYGITLRLYRDDKVFGPGVAELLETVAARVAEADACDLAIQKSSSP